MATIGSFGPIVFEVSSKRVLTFQGLKRERKARFEEHKPLGAKPRLEFLAPELATISFSVQLSAAVGVSPLVEIDKLAEICLKGQAERLVLGGQNMDLYVLESVSETWRHTTATGEVVSAAVTLSLKEYV